jgi:hypothetical protein
VAAAFYLSMNQFPVEALVSKKFPQFWGEQAPYDAPKLAKKEKRLSPSNIRGVNK